MEIRDFLTLKAGPATPLSRIVLLKRILLSAAVAGVLVVGYCSRRKLHDKLQPLYQAVMYSQPESVAKKPEGPPVPVKAPATRRLHANNSLAEAKSVRPVVTRLSSVPDSSSDLAGDKPAPPVVTTPGSNSAPQTPDKIPYTVMIVGTGSSYGGFQDLGIFRNESVYTVYIGMEISEAPAPAWILQYAPLQEDASNPASTSLARRRFRSIQSIKVEAPVQAPILLEKISPQFPPEVVATNPGKMIQVYSVINAEGKMEQTRILSSSVPTLNQPLLDALRKWAFRPAKRNGGPVAVKSILGIVLPDNS